MKKVILFSAVFALLLAPTAAVDNVTLELAFNPDTVVIDGSETTTDTTVTSFDNPFISSKQPTGLIGLSNTVQMSYTNGSRERVEVTESGRSGEFLIPFTEGGYSTLLNRETEIADNTLLDLRPPTFAFEQIDPSVSVIYDFTYPVTDITGPRSGLETIIIRNRLDSDNETQFVLRTE